MQSNQNDVEVNGSVSDAVLALDIGGTFVKSGLIDQAGNCIELPALPIDSDGQADAVSGVFEAVVQAGEKTVATSSLRLAGIGVCMPGPADYARGVSLMTHKFKALNGIELAPLMLKALRKTNKSIPVGFRHDANAFLEGELNYGAGRGFKRAIGVTLGTGIGVACDIEGKLLTNELGSPAEEVSVWSRDYRDGTVEDYVSSRALVKAYCQVSPDYDVSEGAKGIAIAALNGKEAAKKVYAGFGADLGAVLAGRCLELKPEVIIFGGQIARDMPLFVPSMETALENAGVNPLPQIRLAELGGKAALYGAAGTVHSFQQ